MKDFEDLQAWQEAVKLAKSVYLLTKELPQEELYGLSSQLRRASVSISSNLAEGFGRYGRKDKERFYIMALGSLLEVKSQIYVAVEIGYLQRPQVEKVFSQITTTHKLINALAKSLRGTS